MQMVDNILDCYWLLVWVVVVVPQPPLSSLLLLSTTRLARIGIEAMVNMKGMMRRDVQMEMD